MANANSQTSPKLQAVRTVIDLAVWSAVPSLRTLLGAAVIIACGLYLIRYETRNAATPAP